MCAKRWDPDDVGKVVASLDKGDFMRPAGQVIMVAGGLTIPQLLSFLNRYDITERKQEELKIYRKD